LRTKFHTKRIVIRTVPISASNAAFLSVMVGVCTLLVTAATLASCVGAASQSEETTGNQG
jgi:hypothetical protein